ncbi:MAG: hypothetical protein ICV81_05700 [Flavisolibacter sp.]|nr:hypothetical protein [Flavisolibacter sp.]
MEAGLSKYSFLTLKIILMKTMLTVVFLLSFTLITAIASDVYPSKISKPPITGAFNYFRAHRQSPGIALTWAPATPDVVEFIVEKSYDGEYFDQVQFVNGKGISVQKFLDKDVFPGFIHYRIIAVMADGSMESSSVETVRIVRHG